MLILCAIEITVMSLNFYLITFWKIASVFISKLEVAVSRKIILLFLTKILVKLSNCFCPTENTSELFDIYVKSCFGKALI